MSPPQLRRDTDEHVSSLNRVPRELWAGALHHLLAMSFVRVALARASPHSELIMQVWRLGMRLAAQPQTRILPQRCGSWVCLPGADSCKLGLC